MRVLNIIAPIMALTSSVLALSCKDQQQKDGKKPAKCVNPWWPGKCPSGYRSVKWDSGCPNKWLVGEYLCCI